MTVIKSWTCGLHGTPFVNNALLKNAGSLLATRHPTLQLNPKMHRMLSWENVTVEAVDIRFDRRAYVLAGGLISTGWLTSVFTPGRSSRQLLLAVAVA